MKGISAIPRKSSDGTENDCEALMYASDELKADREVVMEAVKANCSVFF